MKKKKKNKELRFDFIEKKYLVQMFKKKYIHTKFMTCIYSEDEIYI
jgi:hypothetical protein